MRLPLQPALPLTAALLASSLAGPLSAQTAELEKLLGGNTNSQDRFGTAVSLSGTRAAVGSLQDGEAASTAGAVFVFERLGDGSWVETGKLLAADAAAADRLGGSVSLSGDRLLAGAHLVNGVATDTGAAYLFERQPDGTWLEVAKLEAGDPEAGDEFGYSVALAGDRAVVGAWREDEAASSAGAAYVFERQANGTWLEVQKLLASDADTGDDFGWSVAISGDALIVGADTWDQSNGAAYVFERQPGGTWLEVQRLLASDSSPLSYFGQSVALDGDLAVVGAESAGPLAQPSLDYGAAYVFERQGNGTWLEIDRLEASDKVDEDWFGYSVGLSGERIVVGARRNAALGNSAGSAYLFERVGAAWVERQKVTGSDTTGGDLLGNAVAVSGDLFLVGAPNDDDQGSNSGSAYLFDAEPLSGGPATISLSAGGVQALELDAGHLRAGEVYLLLGTITGTAPGLAAAPGIVLPLNPDPYFLLTLNSPNQPPLTGSFAFLNAAGHGTATFGLPAGFSPGLAGLTFHHAFVTVNFAALSATSASNALPVMLVP